MKKRIISIMLTIIVAASVMTGCKTTTEETAEATETTEAASEETEPVPAVEQKQVYVSPEWVDSVIAGNQKESDDYVILECSWGTESDAPQYTKGHVPGAVHMNTDNVEEEVNWNIRSGAELEQMAKDFGITKDTTVICYSDSVTNAADDRVAFAMLWAGVENVKCIDGGLEAWVNAGYGTETGSNSPETTETAFGTAVPAHPEYILSIDEVQEKLANDDQFKLVSIRSREEFLGETSGYSYMDKAGEPKGAIWGHDTDDGSYAADGKIADISVLEGYLEESKASFDNELSFYCGTGWRATIPFLMMYQAGYTNMSLYDGGWFVWIMDDANEVQVGDPASDDVVYTTVGNLSNDKALQ